MAGLIKALFGGKPSPAVDAEPVPGIGGYTQGRGPTGQSGFPGSTSQTRTNRNKSPRSAKINADTNTGFEQGLSGVPQVRQAAFRGDQPTRPRQTPPVSTPQPVLTRNMQDVPATNLGGMMLHTGPGNNVAGNHPLSPAQRAGGHSMIDTTTPYSKASPVISGNVPGAQNVRNTIAQRYKNPAGLLHTYKSFPRPDQAPRLPSGGNADGNVKPDLVTQDVTVQNRGQYPANGGNYTWSVMREIPYGRRGDGARGADLNGQRYFATGQEDQFWNGSQGSYGIHRQRGSRTASAINFTQPAPWSSNVYTTTQSVGTQADPNTSPGQQPDAVYVSPPGRRASRRTGRRG